MITEAYCSFEVAKLLKEKGFHDPCIATYNSTTKNFQIEEIYEDWTIHWKNYISAPTHQMAMAWLREVHKVFISIDAYTANHWDGYIDTFEIDIFKNASRIMVPREIAIHNIYEETVEAALKYCLENLI